MASKKQAKTEIETRFNGPAGETAIRLYDGMVQDLPPLWTIRYQDLVQSFVGGQIGNQEFFARLTAIMTHLPDVPGNQRIDPRQIDLGQVTHEQLVDMIRAGVEMQPHVLPSNSESADDEVGDAKNA